MKGQLDFSSQTAVDGVANLPWGNASGTEVAGKSFDFGFTPRAKTEVVFQRIDERKELIAERLFEATAGAKIWASSVAMKLDRGTRDRLFRQLDNLHDLDEWFEGDTPVALESFKSFVRAIIVGAVGGRPGLSLTPNGNLIALWREGGTKLAVEFQPNDFARYLWSQKVDGELERAAGTTKIDRLPCVLAPLKTKAWSVGC